MHPVNQRREAHGVYGSLVHEICVFSSYDHWYLQIVVLVRFGVEHWPHMDEFNKVLWCTVVSHVSVRACPRAENQPTRWLHKMNN